MAIESVRAQINGQWYNLEYDGSSGQYKATISAPTVTSWSQPGHTYNVTVEATNDAGTVGTADGTTIPELKLRVLEKTAPVITIISPSSGAYVNNNKQPIIFTATDEANGSGVDTASLVLEVDGSQIDAGQISSQVISNGYQYTYTPTVALDEGQHTVTVDISDNDGNAAAQKSAVFTVDTVPPTLNVTSPVDELITNNQQLTVAGLTNDATSSPVAVTIKLNNIDQGEVAVDSGGAFSKAVTLTEGQNTIVVTATDAAGKSSVVTRTVTLDTSVPQITSAAITPNPVDAGQTMIISVVIA